MVGILVVVAIIHEHRPVRIELDRNTMWLTAGPEARFSGRVLGREPALKVNGEPVPLAGDRFQVVLPLQWGDNTLQFVLTARDPDSGEVKTDERTQKVRRDPSGNVLNVSCGNRSSGILVGTQVSCSGSAFQLTASSPVRDDTPSDSDDGSYQCGSGREAEVEAHVKVQRGTLRLVALDGQGQRHEVTVSPEAEATLTAKARCSGSMVPALSIEPSSELVEGVSLEFTSRF